MSVLQFFRRLRLVPQGLVLVITAFLPIIAIVAMYPALPSLIAHFSAIPGARWKVPMMISAPGLAIAALAPLAGLLIDRFGRLRILKFATLLYGLAGAAPFLLNDLGLIFASRLLLGVAEALILTTVNTLIGDYWPDRERRDWLFLQGLVGPFLSIAVVVGAGAAAARHWNWIFLIYLVAFPILLAMMRYLFEPDATSAAPGSVASESNAAPQAADPAKLPMGVLVMIGAVTLLAATLYYVFIISGGLLWPELGIRSAAAIGRLTAVPSAFVLLGALVFKLLANRQNAVQLGVAFLLLGSGLVFLGFAPSWRVLVVALCVQQTGAGMMIPALLAWAQTKFGFARRGLGMGVWTSTFFLGQFISPFLVHQADRLTGTIQHAFLAAGTIGLVSALFALGRTRIGRTRPALTG